MEAVWTAWADDKLAGIGALKDLGARAGEVKLNGGQEFAAVCGEWNALVVTHSDGGSVHVAGRGAGRWPTTESIVADLFEVRRHRSRL